MKMIRLTFVLLLLLAQAPAVWAIRGVLANDQDILNLKRDLRDNKIMIGKTRLNQIRDVYGDAASINDTSNRITYDYGDLRIVFDKVLYWKGWTFDTFKDPVYTNNVDNLRFDLESKQLTGENVTLDQVLRSYGEPTSSMETTEDGGMAAYYYGNIKLIFENYIVVRSWRGENLGATDEVADSGVLTK